MAITTAIAMAGNPFITMQYAADPSAHVFDGRLYVYPSHDRNDAKSFDMKDHHVYSTDDLQNWQDHGVVLEVKNVPWAQSHLWAPDAALFNGTYYLAICPRQKPPLKGPLIGVATGPAPAGPFTPRSGPIPGIKGYDPSIFSDDDNQPYLTWTDGVPMLAKLNADFTAIDGPVTEIEGLDGFFEGGWIFKRDQTYYFTYSAKMRDRGRGQWLSYATAEKPSGPYTFRGQITGSETGNIHGSQVEYGGHWYCFYHDRSMSYGTFRAGFKRAIRVEEMFFNDDGTIRTLKWTPGGPKQLKWLDPYRKNQAECLAQTDVPEGPHAIDTKPCPGGIALTQIQNGDWARYAGVDFGGGAVTFSAAVSAHAGGKIELRLNTLDGPLIGTAVVPASADGLPDGPWTIVTAAVQNAKGVHDLCLTFVGPPGDLFEIDTYQFAK